MSTMSKRKLTVDVGSDISMVSPQAMTQPVNPMAELHKHETRSARLYDSHQDRWSNYKRFQKSGVPSLSIFRRLQSGGMNTLVLP
jgi:hypothetical protein